MKNLVIISILFFQSFAHSKAQIHEFKGTKDQNQESSLHKVPKAETIMTAQQEHENADANLNSQNHSECQAEKENAKGISATICGPETNFSTAQ